MQVTTKTINASGIAEIHAFLAANHKRGGEHFSPSMLRAWADQAEFSLSEGNDAGIELRASESIHGYAQTFTVSDSGIDSELVEIDE